VASCDSDDDIIAISLFQYICVWNKLKCVLRAKQLRLRQKIIYTVLEEHKHWQELTNQRSASLRQGCTEESRALFGKSCTTVKRLRNSPCHTCRGTRVAWPSCTCDIGLSAETVVELVMVCCCFCGGNRCSITLVRAWEHSHLIEMMLSASIWMQSWFTAKWALF